MTIHPAQHQLQLLGTLIQLEQSARHAQNLAELGFVAVNQSLRLIRYRQAILWVRGPGKSIRIQAVSGADALDRHAPFVVYLRALIREWLSRENPSKIQEISPEQAGETWEEGWAEWNLGHLLWAPLIPPEGALSAGLLFCRETAWEDPEIALVERLADAYGHAFWALGAKKRPWHQKLASLLPGRGMAWILVLAMVALMFLPVRISALAPAEIVPLDPLIVSAPLEGVIRRFHVEPNQTVKKGRLLFSLDDTALRNEYQVSQKSLAVAVAEHRKAANKAFTDRQSRADVLLLKARIEEKTAEVEYMAEMLAKSRVHAPQAGIAVFSDVNDWLGKPVAVGEKVMTIADPGSVEAEIRLPVADAINLESGAQVKIFLDVAPHRPLSARLRQASYEASVTPEGDLAFQLKASLSGDQAPRIGLRGTAKIYGEQVSLFYYLMRRPFAAFRQQLGI